MWISANSFFYMPFTPIPLTMQVLTVLVSALALGGYWGAVAMLEYVFLGLMGAPVFAGFKTGLIAIPGPTGGFIIGFIAAAFGAGLIYRLLVERSPEKIKGPGNINIMFAFFSCLAGIIIIYSTGYLHFAGYLYMITGHAGPGHLLLSAFKLSVAPFAMLDLMKALIALLIYRVVLYEKN